LAFVVGLDTLPPSLPAFQFKRPKPDGPVLVLKEQYYVMREYDQRTGKTAWQRIVLGTHREHVETWLQEHYPVPPALVRQ
jgi:hypothetical protein